MSNAPPPAGTILSRFFAGDPRALARLLSLVENGHKQAGAVLTAVYPRARNAYRVGLTGAPGAGKSTLVSRLAALMMAEGASVAVVAVDPTSPFTGGALLGDRIRFTAPPPRAGQKPAFFRSAASRGSQGGLARATEEMSVLLDAFGYERLLIESVGVGQLGLDIAEACDTTAVLLVPESGDDIQALKAGLLEIADVLVVNKADRPGAETLARDLREALHLRQVSRRQGWTIPVVLASAESGEGVPAVLQALEAHRRFRLAEQGGEGLRKARLRQVILNLLREEFHFALAQCIRSGRLPDGQPLEPALDAVQAGRENPFGLVRRAVEAVIAPPAADGDA
jgi:LAO/AO transport system kinase